MVLKCKLQKNLSNHLPNISPKKNHHAQRSIPEKIFIVLIFGSKANNALIVFLMGPSQVQSTAHTTFSHPQFDSFLSDFVLRNSPRTPKEESFIFEPAS